MILATPSFGDITYLKQWCICDVNFNLFVIYEFDIKFDVSFFHLVFVMFIFLLSLPTLIAILLEIE